MSRAARFPDLFIRELQIGSFENLVTIVLLYYFKELFNYNANIRILFLKNNYFDIKIKLFFNKTIKPFRKHKR